MPAIPSFDAAALRAVSEVLGDTDHGLTNTEIGQLLQDCSIAEIGFTQPNKRTRLFEALRQRQAQDGCANSVLAFVRAAMSPVRYLGENDTFEERRAAVNKALSFAGLSVTKDGQLERGKAATTLDEAEERASRLRQRLHQRTVHAQVLAFCKPELLQENYFHAVLEASKSVAERIRQKTGLTEDGQRLVDRAFGFGSSGLPLMAFNRLQTSTEKSEHNGIMNIMKGVFGAFRNPLAHEPKVRWRLEEQDALDILSTISLIHRKLDQAQVTGARP